MWSGRVAFENDVCPVGEELLGQLYRTHENGLSALVSSVSADVRAMLALYCYRRSHMHALGVAIATSCEERDLVQWGGRVGATLFAISRQSPGTRAGATVSGNRRTITLSTVPLSKLAPMEDVDDEDVKLAAPAAS